MKPCSAAFGWAWTGSAAKAAMTAAMARVMNFVMNWSFLNVGYDREPHALGGNIGENSLPLQLPREGTRAALSQIGRAHLGTPVTTAHLVCRLLLDKKKHMTEKQ